MPIDSVAKEIMSVRPASSVGLESKYISGRAWPAYELNLSMSPEILRNTKILNFGSGSSHLKRDLNEKSINCEVVEFDLQFDPWRHDENNSKIFDAIPINLFSIYAHLFNSPENQKKLVELKRKSAKTEGRAFIQGDGRTLPFSDRAFDYILSLGVIYQLPLEAKEKVFRELMRVGNILHLSPVFKIDYDLLTKLVAESEFEIVACFPLPEDEYDSSPPKFQSASSYNKLMISHYEFRIKVPKETEPKVISFFGHKTIVGGDGSVIVLRRKES